MRKILIARRADTWGCPCIILMVLILYGTGFAFPLDLLKHADSISTAVTATQKASRPITDEEEYYIGRAVAARLLSSFPLLKDRKATEYLNYVGQSVALHSDKPYTYGGYHFAILASDAVNAFACPGGTIFLTRGMLRAVTNEDELAAVLAHEIAHVGHRDGIAAIKNSRWTEAATVIGSTAAKEYGPRELSSLVNIFEGSIDDVVKTLVVNGYGKTQEYDADKTALAYLEKTGYRPAALKDFLARLSEQGKAAEGGLMKTHPSTKSRIEKVSSCMPEGKTLQTSVNRRAARFHETLQ